MQCKEFRERIGADPALLDETCAGHERECSSCAAYARRLRSSEKLIAAALHFDVAGVQRGGVAAAPRRLMPQARAWAAAASVAIAAIALWLGLELVPSDEPARLAEAVQNHWYEEPQSWVRSTTPVAASVLEAALGDVARVDLSRLDVVSYARSCLMNGRWVPHLVLQGESGPVMLLLLSAEPLSGPLPLDIPEESLRGLIVPLEQGSVAILGNDEEPFEDLQREVTSAVEWTI